MKMKTDWTDARVGLQIKGHPGYKQWQPPLTSLITLIILELEPGLLSAGWGGGIFQIPEGYLHTCSESGGGAGRSWDTALSQDTEVTFEF